MQTSYNWQNGREQPCWLLTQPLAGKAKTQTGVSVIGRKENTYFFFRRGLER
jgi:hypothetical protein